MTPKPGKVYRDGDGTLVHIMGETRGTDYKAWWSLEGNHYDEQGRMVHREKAHRYALVSEAGTHSDGGKGEGWAHSVCTACGAEG